MRALASLGLAFALLVPAFALAQPGPPPDPNAARAWRDLRVLSDGGAVLVATAWEARTARGRRATVTLTRLDAQLQPVGAPLRVYQGEPVLTAVATSGDAVLVGLVNGGARPFIKAAVVSLAGPAPRVLRTTSLPRGRVPAGLSPGSVVACADPDGFSLLWQEQGAPEQDVVTTLARLHPDGTTRGAPVVAAIPWALGAVAWNGHGYHLAVLFGGWNTALDAGHERVCLVTLAPDGRPEQHPWWASAMDTIGEVQLLASPGGMHVTWRSGETVRHVLSTGVGAWGQEPAAAGELGAVGAAQAYALRDDGMGSARLVVQGP